MKRSKHTSGAIREGRIRRVGGVTGERERERVRLRDG
jgi:hypothetical protein